MSEKNSKNTNKGQKRKPSRNIISDMLKHAKYRARKKKIEFSLLKEDITIPKICPVLGIEIIPYSFYNSPSLDRIDNKKGYTKENIIVVSFKANMLKGAASMEELEKIIQFYNKLENK